MSAPPYQKFFWGSYHKHTAHLTHAREHGAYLLLIAALWNNEGKLPADDDTLAGYAHLSAKEWEAVKPKLMRLFRVSRGKLTQARVTEDLAKYRDTSGKRKASGKLGGTVSGEKRRVNREANASVLPIKPEPEPEPKEERAGTLALVHPAPSEAGLAPGPRTKGSRLKGDWTPSAENTAYAVAEGFTEGEARRLAEDFRDYWTSVPGARGLKLDWTGTWRKWVRTEADRRPQRATKPPRRMGFV